MPLGVLRCLKGQNGLVSCTHCAFSTNIPHLVYMLSRSHFGIKNLNHTMQKNIERMLFSIRGTQAAPGEFGAAISNKSRLSCPQCNSVGRWTSGKVLSKSGTRQHFRFFIKYLQLFKKNVEWSRALDQLLPHIDKND